MASLNNSGPAVFQQFLTEDGAPLQSVKVRPISPYGDLGVLWNDVQDTFVGVDYLGDKKGERAFFEMSSGETGLTTSAWPKYSPHPFTVNLRHPVTQALIPTMRCYLPILLSALAFGLVTASCSDTTIPMCFKSFNPHDSVHRRRH
ncbi:MAG: hypothetical protein BYD32DRAFT_488683 [Podila humilis]|nr:MAG: hypothetical protein BYD32DRAFT_488683 [Podila humilis]